MKKILVVVDMQNDFITGPLGTPEAVSIVDKVVEKIRGEEWDTVITTHDTHYSNYLKTQEGKNLPVEHCIYNTEGWWLHDKIRHVLISCGIKRKQAFWTPLQKETFGAFNLPKIIGEDFYGYASCEFEVTFVGVCTDICVISNALLLKAHYPEMKIVVDASCCAGTTPEKHRMALEVMKSCQVEVVNEPKTTNGDRLRKMSNEELAKFIYRCDPVCDNGICTGNGDIACIRCAIDYLNKESEE